MNISPFTIKLVDKNDSHEIEALERTLFTAFKNSKDRSLEAIWDFGYSEQRIKLKIPYDNMEIMTVRFEGSIVAGSALNFTMQNKLQLEYFGFTIDKNEPCICEGLYVFNLYSDMRSLYELLSAFRKSLFEYLVSNNLKKVYATCSQRRLRNYHFLGFKDIDMKTVNGQKKYLLTIDI